MAVDAGILLDTHAWIWLRFGLLAAKPEVMAAIQAAAENDAWFVSSFAMYEIAHAVSRKRLTLDRPLLDWLQASAHHGAPRVIELSPEIAAATLRLPADFHGDPGDRLLAATAISKGLTLCTHDVQLLRYGKLGFYHALPVKESKS